MRKPLIHVLATALILMTFGACKPEAKAPAPEADTKTAPTTETTPEVKPEDTKPADPAAADAKPAEGEYGHATAAEGGGKWITSTTYSAKFRVPEDWKIDITPDGITATDSDDTTTVVLVGSESEGMIQSAINDVKKKVVFKDAKFDKSGQVVLNGLPGQNVTGTAVITKEDGMDQEIQFIAYNVKIGKKAVTVMIFSEAEMYEAKKEIIDGIAQTLTKAS